MKLLPLIAAFLVVSCADSGESPKEAPLSCDELAHGEQKEIITFSLANVPYGESCDDAKVISIASCDNGNLSYSTKLAQFNTCDVEPAKTCQTDDGLLVSHGSSTKLKRYSSEEVEFGESCNEIEVEATCNNGTLELQEVLSFPSCSPKEPVNCDGMKHGDSKELTQYLASSVKFGESCETVKETRTSTCNNGVISLNQQFSPEAVHIRCEPEAPKQCGNAEEGFVNHNSTKILKRYSAPQVSFGESCNAKELGVEAICKNGSFVFDPTGTFPSCEAEAPKNCGSLAHENSETLTRYTSNIVTSGSCEEVKETRESSCYNGELSLSAPFSPEAIHESCSEAEVNYEAYFSPNGGTGERLKEILKGAEKSIFVSMYSMSGGEIRDILLDKASKGLDVAIVFNKGQCDGYKKKSCEDIEAAGGKIRMFSKTNHQKFAVIDHENLNLELKTVAVSGSGNWSNSSFTRYDDDLVVFHRDQDVKDLLQEFSIVWNNGRQWGEEDEKMNIASLAEYTNSGLNISTSENFVFSGRGVGLKKELKEDHSKGAIQSSLVKEMDQATSTIHIATAHFRLESLYEAALRAAERGVKVSLVTDQQEYTYNSRRDCEEPGLKDLDECLSVKGIDVKWKTYSAKWEYTTAKQMHMKYIVIDSSKVLTGSFNFSKTAETSNLETLHIIDDARISADYLENFAKLRSYGSDEELQEIIKRTEEGELVCLWSPLSLSLEVFSDLRSRMFEANPEVRSLCATL